MQVVEITAFTVIGKSYLWIHLTLFYPDQDVVFITDDESMAIKMKLSEFS